MKLSSANTQLIISYLLRNEDHRKTVWALINAQFLEYAIEFFMKVADAKIRNQAINGDWYKREFVTNEKLTSSDIMIHAGINEKTLRNIHQTASRQVVLDVTPEYYDELLELIQNLTLQDNPIELTLTIKLRGVSVELNINESLIVINTLAVKRAQFSGGAWSTLGKQIEKPLMLTLCALFGVTSNHYRLVGKTSDGREVDFYLINGDNEYPCEVKLMGKGNPEVADAIFARQSAVFIADKLSDMNKSQSESLNIHWVELSAPNGYRQFYDALQKLNIPAKPFTGDLESALETIFASLFS